MLNQLGLVLWLWAILALPGQASAQTARNTEPFHAGVTDAAALEREVGARLERAKKLLHELLAVTGPRTLENTLVPFDEMAEQVENARWLARAMEEHPDAAMRTAAERLRMAAVRFWRDVTLRRDAFDAIGAIDLSGVSEAPTVHYVNRALADYRRDGIELGEAQRVSMRRLDEELTKTVAVFQRNIRDGNKTLKVSEADLEGVPRDFIARQARTTNGEVTLVTNRADMEVVLTFARSRELRQRAFTAWRNVAYPENDTVLREMLGLRSQVARQLGFPNWAEYNAASRMTKTAGAVSAFIDGVLRASERKAAVEYRELLERKRRDDPSATTLLDWEQLYYTNLVRRERYALDTQLAREYFPADRVIAGVLDVATRMYGVTFRSAAVPVWHPSVRAYELLQDGQMVGRFYLDLHPRAYKSGGAARMSGVRTASARLTPEAIIFASLPGGAKDDPGLMSHDDVRTLFHEFGHLVHHMMASRSPWHGLNGLPAESDVVEAPSTMTEMWIWDAKTLQTFARHYRTDELIPTSLVARMVRASEFGKGLEARRQATMSAVALALHERPADGLDPQAIARELTGRHIPIARAPDNHFEAGWPHLANPLYTSAYYTYLWSNVIAKDLFTQFDKSDLLAPGPAHRYRDTFLAPGKSKPADALVKDFLGRPFRIDAWERWLNEEPSIPPSKQ